ncbi:hypothetical protein DL93DRAFT_1702815 [Clavulina sp. PMI_390]|nr:hypothetical protein DL93DRAFT_1702815 [Clavulina sp. PMI_390]
MPPAVSPPSETLSQNVASSASMTPDLFRSQLVELMSKAKLAVPPSQTGDLELVWSTFRMKSMLPAHMGRLVEAGLVTWLKNTFQMLAIVPQPWAPQMFRVGEMAFAGTSAVGSMSAILQGPGRASWDILATRQFHDNGVEFCEAIRKLPWIATTAQCPKIDPRDDAMVLCKRICTHLPRHSPSKRAVHAAMRLAYEIWNPSMPPPMSTSEQASIGSTISVFSECINCLNQDISSPRINVAQIVGTSFDQLIKRTVQLLRLPAIDARSRAFGLLFIYDLFNAGDPTNRDLLKAMADNQAIPAIAETLTKIDGQSGFNEPGEMSVQDRMHIFWFTFLKCSRDARIDGALEQAVTADMIRQTEHWSSYAHPDHGIMITAGLRTFFDALKRHPKLFVKAAGQLARSYQALKSTPRLPRPILEGWMNAQAMALRTFNDISDNISDLPKCAVCGSAWSIDGQALQVCSGCRNITYCSRKCQRSDWPTHKAPCKAQTTSSK